MDRVPTRAADTVGLGGLLSTGCACAFLQASVQEIVKVSLWVKVLPTATGSRRSPPHTLTSGKPSALCATTLNTPCTGLKFY